MRKDTRLKRLLTAAAASAIMPFLTAMTAARVPAIECEDRGAMAQHAREALAASKNDRASAAIEAAIDAIANAAREAGKV